MLYEFIGIVRKLNNQSAEVKNVCRTMGKLIIENRGVVRKIQRLPKSQLPRIVKKNQEQHFQGDHFLMQFDCSAAVQRQIVRAMNSDPRVIYGNIMKAPEKSLAPPTSLDYFQN